MLVDEAIILFLIMASAMWRAVPLWGGGESRF